jgi:hypothetical protein
VVVNPTGAIRNNLGPLLDGATECDTNARDLDMALLFATQRRALEGEFARPAPRIVANGMLWVCWPKQATKLPTDITEDVLRQVLLPTGWVDVKVCANDAQWSAQKFVRRSENRQVNVRTRK